MADSRLVELALEALEARRSALDAEIARLRGEINASGSATPARGGRRAAGRAAKSPAPRRRRSAAARKAQSAKMKEYWARRKQLAASGETRSSAQSRSKK